VVMQKNPVGKARAEVAGSRRRNRSTDFARGADVLQVTWVKPKHEREQHPTAEDPAQDVLPPPPPAQEHLKVKNRSEHRSPVVRSQKSEIRDRGRKSEARSQNNAIPAV